MIVTKIGFISNIYLKQSQVIEYNEKLDIHLLLFGDSARAFVINSVWPFELVKGNMEQINMVGLLAFIDSPYSTAKATTKGQHTIIEPRWFQKIPITLKK